MSVCLLLIDDGRADYMARCLESVGENLPPFDHQVTILDPDHELGFDGAVREGWRQVLETGAEWVFHAESDFLYNEPVDVHRMVAVLRRHPHLTQMSLLRQAWNDSEKAAGGIVQQWPEDFHEVSEAVTKVNGYGISYLADRWLETRRFIFTTNPSVYSTRLCERGWPQAPESEGKFGAYLLRDEPWRKCGIWGGKDDPPRVTHIGDVRAGVGY